ncbi:MAG: hypothetical protein JWL76_348 [Thermoleophilia bacterium]|nr:hypothetical protein [Thermoleophilia bacterium]
MRISPTLASVQSDLHAAEAQAVDASYLHGAGPVAEALRSSSDHVQAAVDALGTLCPAEPTACAALQSIEGLRSRLDSALQIAKTLDPENGQLPVGTVDPVYDVLQDATRILFASRWG